MAEREHASALDIGDGARRAELQVAGDQRDADGNRPGGAVRPPEAGPGGSPPEPEGREHEPRAVEGGERTGRGPPVSPPMLRGSAIGRSAPASPGENGEAFAPAGHASGTNDRAGRSIPAKASVSAASGAPIGIGAIRGPGAAAPRVVASTISPIGVMPAMGSVANDPSAYDTAPMIRPSTYTGLPLMPAMTPVLASGPPLSRARIRSRWRSDVRTHHAQDVCLELLDGRSLEHGTAHARHARQHLLDRHVAGGRRRRNARRAEPGR